MRYKFHDVHFNLNSKSQNLPCEGNSQSRLTRDAAAEELERRFEALNRASTEKINAHLRREAARG